MHILGFSVCIQYKEIELLGLSGSKYVFQLEEAFGHEVYFSLYEILFPQNSFL